MRKCCAPSITPPSPFINTSHHTPAAEWLLDNFYLLEEQIRLTRRLLPRRIVRNCRGWAGRWPIAVFSWVYDIALELISHVDAPSTRRLNGFVAAYQSVEPLKFGELWAMPLMLKLGLIENLHESRPGSP